MRRGKVLQTSKLAKQLSRKTVLIQGDRSLLGMNSITAEIELRPPFSLTQWLKLIAVSASNFERLDHYLTNSHSHPSSAKLNAHVWRILLHPSPRRTPSSQHVYVRRRLARPSASDPKLSLVSVVRGQRTRRTGLANRLTHDTHQLRHHHHLRFVRAQKDAH